MRKVLAVFMFLLIACAAGEDYTEKRQEMLSLIISRGITDQKTIEAMSSVPRHLFVPEDLRDEAYNDYPLPIGYGQTISQPYVVALMTSSLNLTGGEKALEVGTGSGYQAAVLSEIVDQVYTVEIIPELAQRAEKTLKDLGYNNVSVLNADGYFGWEAHQPYDVIMITAAVDHIPPPLISQLKEGGRLVLPLGNPLYYQTLTLVQKENGAITTTYLTDVTFVPLTGYAQTAKREEERQRTEEEKKETPAPTVALREEIDKKVYFAVFALILSAVLVWKFSTRRST